MNLVQWLRPMAVRALLVMAPRTAVVMTGAGAATDYTSRYIDLSGDLPVAEARHYPRRDLSEINGLVIHHSATKGRTIRSMAEYHIEVKGWPGLAYHYAIGWDGVVYHCQDDRNASYHTQGHNRHNVGVVLVGDYEAKEPSEAMIRSLGMLIEDLRGKYRMDHAWMHRETKATLCPGSRAVPHVQPLLFGPRPHRRTK